MTLVVALVPGGKVQHCGSPSRILVHLLYQGAELLQRRVLPILSPIQNARKPSVDVDLAVPRNIALHGKLSFSSTLVLTPSFYLLEILVLANEHANQKRASLHISRFGDTRTVSLSTLSCFCIVGEPKC